MKQLLVLSGKGGTGKTTIASALIKLFNSKAYADCDVDAPNLHLINIHNSKPINSKYYGLNKAFINIDSCNQCGECLKMCRFNAIEFNDKFSINTSACEGCGVCELICPTKAINLIPDVAGETYLYKDNEVFSTAKLKLGSGTSGKLVTAVKKQLNDIKVDNTVSIIDGSPGIGCPVIASMSGVDLVLIITEPSISGINDMKRIIKTANQFEVDIVICINKYDTNLQYTYKIEEFCNILNIKYLGRIPYDKNAIKAINSGKSVIDIECDAGNAIKDIYYKLRHLI